MNAQKAINYDAIKPILEEYGVEFAGVFGSFARGEASQESDVDILIRLTEPIGLFSLAELQQKLSETLGKKVDLVTEKALSPYIRQEILHDLKPFYGAR